MMPVMAARVTEGRCNSPVEKWLIRHPPPRLASAPMAAGRIEVMAHVFLARMSGDMGGAGHGSGNAGDLPIRICFGTLRPNPRP